MAKNLKEIVDEGFSQLAALANKRREILARADNIGRASLASQGAEAELKVKEAESRFLPEMNARVEQLLNELQQTLKQVNGDSTSFQENLQDSLRLQVSGILAQLEQTKSYLLTRTRGRLDVLLLELETEFQSGRSMLGVEAARLLSDLDSWSLSNRSTLRQSQTEIALKLSLCEYEISALLGRAFSQIVEGAETKRLEVAEFLDSLYHRQLERLEAGAQDLNLRVAPIIREQCEKMRDSCIDGEKSLNQIRGTVYVEAVDELNALSKDPLAKLEAKSADLRQELSEKLNQLRELREALLKQEQSFLLEQSDSITSGADQTYLSLAKLEGAPGAARSPVEDAFAEVSVEFSSISEDLKMKLKNLLSAQSDGLIRLSSSTDKVFTDLFVDFRTQLEELIRNQDHLCAQKEEELFMQLKKLEEQINEANSLLKASGLSGEAAAAKAEDSRNE